MNGPAEVRHEHLLHGEPIVRGTCAICKRDVPYDETCVVLGYGPLPQLGWGPKVQPIIAHVPCLDSPQLTELELRWLHGDR